MIPVLFRVLASLYSVAVGATVDTIYSPQSTKMPPGRPPSPPYAKLKQEHKILKENWRPKETESNIAFWGEGG